MAQAKSERGGKLPDDREVRESVLKARYGEDGYNPLLWELIEVWYHMLRRWKPRARPSQKGATEAVDTGTSAHDSQEGILPLKFYDSVSKAVFDGDAEFFREVARLLESRIQGPAERRVDMEVSEAFATLRARAEMRGGALPTKKQVREAALFSMALSHVLQHTALTPGWGSLRYYPDENGPMHLPPKMLRKVKKEMELLPEQNWTVIFKRCGLADLPSDKGGQPGHRRKRR